MVSIEEARKKFLEFVKNPGPKDQAFNDIINVLLVIKRLGISIAIITNQPTRDPVYAGANR